MHILDTSIAIHIRDNDPAVIAKARALPGGFAFSIITAVELEGGVHRVPAVAQSRRARLDEMLMAITILDFDLRSVEAYRRIVAVCGYSRRKLLDRMIAAQALVHGATLATLNPGDFADVAGLAVEPW